MKNRLKIIRAERNITQAELAKIIGVSRATINQIENGLVIPNGDTMLLLSQKLNTPIEKIFTEFALETNK